MPELLENPLDEVSPEALGVFFSLDVEDLNRGNIAEMVRILRTMRARRIEAEGKPREQKPPTERKPRKTSIKTSPLLEDLEDVEDPGI